MKPSKETEQIPSQKRADIQALRAFAVIAVVLYHAGSYANSGFIGVDIFFVISGFVISKLLFTEYRRTGHIDLKRFYIRRTHRLLPGLGVMVGIFSILAFFLFSPLGMQQNSAKTGLGSLFLGANWMISKVTQGYFDLPAETNLFLHTWSLSVEEQFYLVFPITLIVFLFILRRSKKEVLVFFPVLFITFASLLIYLQFFNIALGPNFDWLNGFYSPLTRTWEFGLGVLSYLFSENYIKRSFNKHSVNILIFILVPSIFLSSEVFKFPSFWLFLPLITTSAILMLGSSQYAVPNRLLSSASLQFIGDRSYSIYLWHWPAIVLSKYLFPDNRIALILFLLAAILLSFFFYARVEEPNRQVVRNDYFKLLKIVGKFFVIPLAFSLMLGFTASEIFFKRYESGKISGHFVGDIGAIGFDNFSALYPANCVTPTKNGVDPLKDCIADVAVIGDSHAQHLLPGFSHNYPEIKFIGLESTLLSYSENAEYKRRLNLLLGNKNIKLVVINAYWAPRSVPNDLDELVKLLTASGKKVTILDDVPNFPFDAFTCKYGLSVFIPSGNCEMNSQKFFTQRARYFPALREISLRHKDSELINTSNLFCNLDKCSMVKGKSIYYLDLNHLNINGSKYVTEWIAEKSKYFCSIFNEKFSSSEICINNTKSD